ncbi:MAG TPA: hypothetical protein VI776_17105 [Anaerolineales bacterium]|nr:hypothetical protein [Anaerolineales bacterium]
MPSLAKRFLRCEACLEILLILAVMALTYLPLISQLGFYKEDWYLIWSGVARSPQDFLSLYQADRPFAGVIYQLVYPLLGPAPLGWHLLSFALRLIGVFAFYWLLRMLWPEHRFAVVTAALLFAVYPGYLQQHNAVNKTFWLTSLTCAVLSLTLTVYATKLRRTTQAALVHLIAMLLALVYLLIIEFYIGFEAVRFVLLWYTAQQREPKPLLPGLGRAVKAYLPYLIPVFVFLYWRIFLFQSTRPTTNVGRLLGEYLNLPVYMLARIFIETVQDFYETAVLAWFVPTYQLISQASYREFATAGLLGLAAFGLVIAYFIWQRRSAGTPEGAAAPERWTIDQVWIGAVAVVATLVPMVVAGREVNFVAGLREDHYTIQASLGVALLVVGFLYAALRPNLRLWVIGFLIAIAVMTHVQNASIQSRNWQVQRQVWWQLAWRAPQLKEGTLLFANLPNSFGFGEGYEAWAPANLIYAPQADIPKIAGEVLNPESVFRIVRGEAIPKNHRNVEFLLDYASPLILSLPTNHSCLNVIDGSRYELSPSEELIVKDAAPYSRIEGVVTGVPFQVPPQAIFGPEPEHDWCYTYQKAMVARQLGDWEAVVRLANEAQREGLAPNDRVEWMPFLEGYALTGREAEARRLAELMEAEQEPRREICRRLLSSPPQAPNYDPQKVSAILCGS